MCKPAAPRGVPRLFDPRGGSRQEAESRRRTEATLTRGTYKCSIIWQIEGLCWNKLQSGFFNCSAQISVLKRKTLFNQRGSFVHQEYHGRESLIGCPTFSILVLKIGRNSSKKHPVDMHVSISINKVGDNNRPGVPSLHCLTDLYK